MSVKEFRLDDTAVGFSEFSDNCWNFSISSDVPGNDSAAEYKAGFIQGTLQKDLIPATRDNTWNNLYNCDPSHTFPRWRRPNRDELAKAQQVLLENYSYLCRYIRESGSKYACRGGCSG